MVKYIELDLESSHQLINHGPVVLLCTRDSHGNYDIAPIAWSAPVQKIPPQVLVVVGKRHQSYRNILETKQYIIAVPHADQAQMVRQAGSVSGDKCDKYAEFNIEHIAGIKVDARVPAGCVGWLECHLDENFDTDKTDIIVGQVAYASVNAQAYRDRLLTETQAGKTLHHLGQRVFAVPSDQLLQ